ncbi:PA14 domain-containing protein [Hymenobacter terrenus]|uniref:PA14 domain-containing protein n=1 Tax=Hymenobacter terrenus TaxID=1629124 RepID=UPI000696C86A|nr:PA14 domain-containing protein [Hymenobacter terrenus]
MKKLILSLLLGTGAWSSVHATDYYVATNGEDKPTAGAIGTPFKTIQYIAGLKKSDGQPVLTGGDVVYIRAGTYQFTGAGVQVKASGTPATATSPAKYIVFRNYLGDAKPLIKFAGWEGFHIKGNVSYIEIRGLRIQGNNQNVNPDDATAQGGGCANPGGPKQAQYNGNGIFAKGEAAVGYPHHLRFIDNEVFDCGGAGIAADGTDHVTIENNLVYNNSWYTIFGTSGISINASRNIDTAPGYHMIIRNNRSFGNRLFVKWYNPNSTLTDKCRGITDGNGIILDVNDRYAKDANNNVIKDANGNPTFASDSYTGRFLIANNLCVNNGGSGIHLFKSSHADVINNTAYLNSQSTEIDNGEIYANQASDVLFQNNISVGLPGNLVFNKVSTTLNVRYVNNLFSGGNITVNTTNNTLTSTGSGTSTSADDAPVPTSVTIPTGTNIVADPLFVNPTTALTTATNFTLKTSPLSPAINAGGGLPNNLVTALGATDLAGSPRVVSTLDRGAYESSFTSTPPPASCGLATSLSTSGVSSTGATLAWAAVSGATSYNVRYRILNTTTWTTTTSTTASKVLTGLTASSNYEFQVQTVCSSTSTSAFTSSATFPTNSGGTTPPPTTTLRNPDTPTNTLPGVNYNYYQGTWTQLPNFSTLTTVKAGNTATFDITPALQPENFAFHFYGYVSVPADGEYTFGTKSNEGSKVYIGNTLVVSNDGLHNANLEQTGKIGLKAGKHFIAVDYFEATGIEFLQVFITGPGVARQIIPGSFLSRRDFSGTTRTALSTSKTADAGGALSAFPNPTHDRATLSYMVEQAGAVRLEVLDNVGRIVAVLVDGPQTAGAHEAVFEAPARQGSALFNVRLITPTGTSVSRLALDK